MGLLLCGAIAACGGDDDGATSVYVGAVSGSDAMIGIAVAGDKALAYVCGGAKSFRTDTEWIAGRYDAAGGRLDLRGKRWSVSATITERAQGTIDDGRGRKLAWTASAPLEDSLAGVYATLDTGCRTGVIVREHGGSAPEVQGAFCDASGNIIAQVTPILPLELTASGIEVLIDTGGAKKRLFVTPVNVD